MDGSTVSGAAGAKVSCSRRACGLTLATIRPGLPSSTPTNRELPGVPTRLDVERVFRIGHAPGRGQALGLQQTHRVTIQGTTRRALTQGLAQPLDLTRQAQRSVPHVVPSKAHLISGIREQSQHGFSRLLQLLLRALHPHRTNAPLPCILTQRRGRTVVTATSSHNSR